MPQPVCVSDTAHPNPWMAFSQHHPHHHHHHHNQHHHLLPHPMSQHPEDQHHQHHQQLQAHLHPHQHPHQHGLLHPHQPPHLHSPQPQHQQHPHQQHQQETECTTPDEAERSPTGPGHFPSEFPHQMRNSGFAGTPVEVGRHVPCSNGGGGSGGGSGGQGAPGGPSIIGSPTGSDEPPERADRRTSGTRNTGTRRASTDDDISNPARRMRRRELSQFSPEEADRILRRRERNKVAATKCRHKRRAQHEHLVKELQDMECENTSLTYEIRQLQRQRQALSDVLRHHQMSCTTRNLFTEVSVANTAMPVTPDGLPGPYPLPYAR